MMNAGLLYVGLARMGIIRPGHVMRGLLARIVIASVGDGGLAGLAGRRPRRLARQPAAWLRVLRLSGLIAGGIVVYFGVLWLLGVRAEPVPLQPPRRPSG